MVNRLNLLVDSGRLVVHPRCKLLIQTLKNGVWDKNRTEFGRSEIGLGHMDALASLIYMNLAFESWFTTNPIPITQASFTNVDMHGRLDSTNQSVWNKVFETKKEVDMDDQLPEIEDQQGWE